MKSGFAFAALALTGCVAVLDLDATPGSGGLGGASDGGSASTTGGPTGQNTGAGSTGAAGPDGSSIASSAAGTGGGSTCGDVAARLSGAQLLTIDNPTHNALDVDGKVAIGAWVQPDPSVATMQSYTGYVLSRLSDTTKKGYGLLVRRSDGDGALYPELRFYVHGVLATCVGQIAIPVGKWSHVAALVRDGHVEGQDAGVWVDGQLACLMNADDAKLDKFQAAPVVGAALGGASGFFRGLMDDVYVSRSGDTPPPPLDGGGCASEGIFFATFDGVSGQTFMPICSTLGTFATLGGSASAASDDPTLDGCQ